MIFFKKAKLQGYKARKNYLYQGNTEFPVGDNSIPFVESNWLSHLLVAFREMLPEGRIFFFG